MTAVAQDPDTSPAGGLFGSLKNLVAILLAVVYTRVELFATEAEEGWMRIASILRWALFVAFFTGLGILFAVLFFVVLFWDSHRLWAVGIPAVLFILAAVVASRIVSAKMGAKPRLFSASLAEWAKDRDRFTSR